jgi:LCP family protein required for cell wall assembly
MTGSSDDAGPPEGGPGDAPHRRQLPPELDPRRPASRRRTPRAAKAPTPARPGQRQWQPSGVLTRWSGRKITAVLAAAMAGTLALGGLFGVAAYSYLTGHITTINPFCHSCKRPAGGAVGDLNILVVGSDSRAGLTKAQENQLHVGHDAGKRSDTMILLHIPAGGGKAVLVNLPRDSYVTIPRHKDSAGQIVPAQKNKINAAYSEGGAKLTIRTVEDATGVRIDHYIEINFLGFVKMVNALGGVDICSPQAIDDPVVRNPATGAYSGSGLVLPKGTSHLDGDTALEYVRAREFDPAQGDLGRIERQQRFMGAMINKARSAGVLLNPIKLVHFLNAVTGSLTTDSGLGAAQITRLAEKLHSMSPKNVTFLTVPLSNTAYATPVGSAVLWDPVKSKELFADFTDDTPITNVIHSTKLVVPPGDISVRVLNASGTAGAAATAASDLSAVGFGIAGTGDAPSGSDPTATVVLYGSSRAQSAATLVAAVPGATRQKDPSLGSGIELLVGSGFSGAHSVKVSTNSDNTNVRTAATNPCH